MYMKKDEYEIIKALVVSKLKIVMVVLACVWIYFGTAFFDYVYKINKRELQMSPCLREAYIVQQWDSIKVTCATSGTIIMMQDDDSKKIYFSVDQKYPSKHMNSSFPIPINTLGYQLCYQNSYGEYCFEKVQ